MNKPLDLYLRLERIMMELDDQGDPFSDRVRDVMDPLWFALSDQDHEFLDNRGAMEIRVLYPITLTVPDLFRLPSAKQSPVVEILPKNGVGKFFELKEAISWAA